MELTALLGALGLPSNMGSGNLSAADKLLLASVIVTYNLKNEIVGAISPDIGTIKTNTNSIPTILADLATAITNINDVKTRANNLPLLVDMTGALPSITTVDSIKSRVDGLPTMSTMIANLPTTATVTTIYNRVNNLPTQVGNVQTSVNNLPQLAAITNALPTISAVSTIHNNVNSILSRANALPILNDIVGALPTIASITGLQTSLSALPLLSNIVSSLPSIQTVGSILNAVTSLPLLNDITASLVTKGEFTTGLSGLPSLNDITVALPTINQINSIIGSITSLPLIEDFADVMSNNFSNWLQSVDIELPSMKKSISAFLSSALSQQTAVRSWNQPWASDYVVDLDNMLTLEEKDQYLKLDLNYAMYTVNKFIIDALYDAVSLSIQSIGNMFDVEDKVILPLPSGAGLLIASKIDNNWVIPDFRLGPYTDNSAPIWVKIWNIVIKLPQFHLPNITLPEIIWPKINLLLKNNIVTDKDLYWKNENKEWVLGSTINRYYRVFDVLVDAAIATLIVGISAALMYFGFPDIDDLFKKKLYATKNAYTDFKKAQDIAKTASTVSSMAAKVIKIQDGQPVWSDDIATTFTNVSALTRDTSSILSNLTTIQQMVTNDLTTDADLALVEERLKSLIKDIDAKIGIRISFL